MSSSVCSALGSRRTPVPLCEGFPSHCSHVCKHRCHWSDRCSPEHTIPSCNCPSCHPSWVAHGFSDASLRSPGQTHSAQRRDEAGGAPYLLGEVKFGEVDGVFYKKSEILRLSQKRFPGKQSPTNSNFAQQPRHVPTPLALQSLPQFRDFGYNGQLQEMLLREVLCA